MHQRARTDLRGGRGETRVPTATHGNADLGERQAVCLALNEARRRLFDSPRRRNADGADHEAEQPALKVLAIADDDVNVGSPVGVTRERVGVARRPAP